MKSTRYRLSSFALSVLLLLGGSKVGLAVSPGLNIVSGNGQVVGEQFRTTVPMVVQAADASGRPLAGLPVTWAITQGQGTLNGSDSVTDSNGKAGTFFVGTNLSAGLSFAAQTVTATTSAGSASFIITTSLSRSGAPPPLAALTAPPAENLTLTGPVGAILPAAIQFQIVAQSGVQQGYPIPNVGIRLFNAEDPTAPPPAVCATASLSDARGVLSCDVRLVGPPGIYTLSANVGEFVNSRNIRLTVTAGTSCTYTLSSTSLSIGGSGGSGSVNVSSGTSCAWTAVSNSNWISLTGGANGAGNGTVSFTVASNPGAARLGTLTIAGQVFTVSQSAAGTGNVLSFSSGAALPSAVAGSPYSFQVTATGGRAPYTYSATALPAGLTLSTAGLLAGTVANAGSYSFTLTATDSSNATIAQNATLSVVNNTPGQNPAITNTGFAAGAVGTPYSQLLTSVGGCTSPFSPAPVYSLVSGALPPGLSITSQQDRTSLISGTPTTNGSYSFTLRVTDVCARFGNSSFAILIGGSGGPGPGPGPGPGLGPVSLIVSPQQVSFQLITGGAASTQLINVTAASGSSQFTTQTQLAAAPTVNWLTATPGTGTTPAALSITASAASLPPGLYTAYVLVQPSGGAVGPQQNVAVTLRVLPPPQLITTPTTLSYVYQPGNPLASTPITIGSTSSSFDFTVTPTTAFGNWLSVTPAAGSTPAILTLLVNPLGLTPGVYTGSINITPSVAGVSPYSIPVTLTIPQSAPTFSAIVNAASFVAGPIAPGEIVTLTGTGLGPANAQSAHITDQGLVDTNLGESRVYFDGVAAPILYTSPAQISVIAPYGIAGRAVTNVQLEYKGARSQPLDVRVADAAPGIFVASADGQAAAINQDGTPNSSRNGAAPGSIVAFYITGEGGTSPNGVDGRLMVNGLAMPLLPVTATVNGAPAEVRYAGSAPFQPAGLAQVNVRIPPDAPTGRALAIEIKVGGAPTQGGVTVYVR